MAKERGAYREALSAIIKKEKVDVLVPTHPVEVRAVAELKKQAHLQGVSTLLPDLDVLDTTDSKEKTHAALKDAVIPVPETIGLQSKVDITKAFDRFSPHGPVWVRGSGAPGLGIGGAALPCRDVKVAEAWVEHYQGWGYMSASRYLPGRNLTWMALYSKGELIASAARERLEYVLPHVSPSGITGAPAVSRTIWEDDVKEFGYASVRAVDEKPNGVYFVDMKCDENDRPMVTEINGGRCGTTIHFYTEAGYNFPKSMVELALGESVPKISKNESAVRPGQYWVRTLDCGPVLLEDEKGFDNYPTSPSALTQK